MKALIGTIADEVLIFRERLKTLVTKSEPFSMEKEMSNLVFDLIGSVVFGFQLHAQKSGSPILDDLRDILDQSQLIRDTWNPVTKFGGWLKRKTANSRVNKYIEAKMRERYAIMKGEELPTRRNAKTILDRVLLERLQNIAGDAGQDLDRDFIDLAVTK